SSSSTSVTWPAGSPPVTTAAWAEGSTSSGNPCRSAPCSPDASRWPAATPTSSGSPGPGCSPRASTPGWVSRSGSARPAGKAPTTWTWPGRSEPGSGSGRSTTPSVTRCPGTWPESSEYGRPAARLVRQKRPSLARDGRPGRPGSGRAAYGLDDDGHRPADHALLLGDPETGAVQAGRRQAPDDPAVELRAAGPGLCRGRGSVRGHQTGHHPVRAVAAGTLAGEGDLGKAPGVQQPRREDVGVPFRVPRGIAGRVEAGPRAGSAGLRGDDHLPALEPEGSVHGEQAEHGLDVGADGRAFRVERVGTWRRRVGREGFGGG